MNWDCCVQRGGKNLVLTSSIRWNFFRDRSVQGVKSLAPSLVLVQSLDRPLIAVQQLWKICDHRIKYFARYCNTLILTDREPQPMCGRSPDVRETDEADPVVEQQG